MTTIENVIKFLNDYVIECAPDDGCQRCNEAREHVAALEKLSLSPAEGAEEMSAREYLDKWMDEHHHLSDRLIGWSVAADFAEDFATLHAQRIADKMVSERLKKVESLLNSAAGLVGNPGANISGSCDVACDMWQKNYEAYLKIRER